MQILGFAFRTLTFKRENQVRRQSSEPKQERPRMIRMMEEIKRCKEEKEKIVKEMPDKLMTANNKYDLTLLQF